MADPVMLSVAAAVAGKAAESAAESGKNALAALVRLIRRRLSGSETALAALDQAGARPDDDAAVHQLAVVLERMVIADPGFAEQFRTLWPQARAELLALQAGTVNSSTGTVRGHLVQARDVHGGLHLGDVQGP